MALMKPLCFVLMPFGTKPDSTGTHTIDFDTIYNDAIKPGIEAAGMRPIRADEERVGGIIHKPMFERLLLCDYAVADITTANANVFYELGFRHAARPWSTLPIFARRQPIPFDVNYLRALPYDLGPDNKLGPEQATALAENLKRRLLELRDSNRVDSPPFQLLEGYNAPDIARLKTDVFRDQVQIAETFKERLADARALSRPTAIERLDAIRQELEPLHDAEAGVIIDLFLSYRDVKGYREMVALYEAMPPTLQRKILVREQLAFAYNRLAKGPPRRPELRDKALRFLEDVEAEQGPSSETCGLIGRVHKDRWQEALEAGETLKAAGHLKKAIEAYVRGFEADCRDAYPGVNAVTLLHIQGDEERRDRLLPVVRFAAERRLEGRDADYWDHATLLELAVLANDRQTAYTKLEDALTALRAPWEAESTRANLEMIRNARKGRSGASGQSEGDVSWTQAIIEELAKAAGG